MRRLGYRRLAALAAIGRPGLRVLGGALATGSDDNRDNSQLLRSQIRAKKPKNGRARVAA